MHVTPPWHLHLVTKNVQLADGKPNNSHSKSEHWKQPDHIWKGGILVDGHGLARRLRISAVKTVQESVRKVEKEQIAKLWLEDGRIILPDPDGLDEEWEECTLSYPELSHISMEKYWDESK